MTSTHHLIPEDVSPLSTNQLLTIIADLVDAKDPYTRGHSQRVALLSRDLAASIGLPDSFVRNAHLAGLVHDIGKIGIGDAVLLKPAKLNRSSDEKLSPTRTISPSVREFIPVFIARVPNSV